MTRCGCGATTACLCVLRAGAGATVSGAGSPTNPYVISATGGSGATCPDPMTIAELVALRDASGLDVCASYVVTDWTLPNSLPGPNLLIAHATASDSLSPEVLVSTPVTLGPDVGQFSWDGALMLELRDLLGNTIRDTNAVGTLDAWVWGSSGLGGGNTVESVTFTGGYAVTSAAVTAGFTISFSGLMQATIDLTGTVFGLINGVDVGIGATITAGAQFSSTTSTIGAGTTITNAGTGPMTITGSTLNEATVDTTGGTGALTISRSTLSFSNVTLSGAGAVTVTDCQLISNSQVYGASPYSLTLENTLLDNSSVDNTGVNQLVSIEDTQARGRCEINLSFATASFPGGATCRVLRCELLGNSDLAVSGTTVPDFTNVRILSESSLHAVSAGSDMTDVVVDLASTLNVQAGGSIIASRVTLEATVNTGAFFHDAVIIEFPGTTTLTASNSNKMKNSLGSNVI